MTALLIALGIALLWFAAPLPFAIACGRSFRAGEVEGEFAAIVADYDAAGV